MTSKERTATIAAGVADARDRKPGRNEPDGDPLSPEVCAYWSGWQSGVLDDSRSAMRGLRT